METPANSVDLGPLPSVPFNNFFSLGGVGNVLYAILFSVTPGARLYQVDVASPVDSIDLGSMPGNGSINGLGGVGNVLYAVERNSPRRLYQVDVASPADSISLGSMPSGIFRGLAGLGNVLYAIDATNARLYQVDVDTPADSINLGALPGSSSFTSFGGLDPISTVFGSPAHYAR